jgi:hypothetical protein
MGVVGKEETTSWRNCVFADQHYLGTYPTLGIFFTEVARDLTAPRDRPSLIIPEFSTPQHRLRTGGGVRDKHELY